MEPERDEVYERIPWETLEKKGGDRQWLAYALAGAVALGALGYSFVRSQPALPPATVAVSAPVTASATTIEAQTTPPPSTVAGPIVVAEADLYAIAPERLIERAAAHAEWFAVEYMSADGTEESRRTLSSLLPAGAPMPETPEGTQVFVDWAGATGVTETGGMSFRVDVVVRSLLSTGEAGFVRQPPTMVTVDVEVNESGLAMVTGLPSLSPVTPSPSPNLGLVDIPEEVAVGIEAGLEIVGGRQATDGSWEVVVMLVGSDGVRRPVTIRP